MRMQCVCGQKYSIKDELHGQHVRCRKCGHHLLVHDGKRPLPKPLPSAAALPAQAEHNVSQPMVAKTIAPQRGFGHPVTVQPIDARPPHDPNDLGALGDVSGQQMPLPVNQLGIPLPPNRFPAKPGPRKPISKNAGMDFSHVNNGLNLIFAGTTISILGALIAIPFLVVGLFGISFLLNLSAFAGTLLAMVGYILCIWVPEQTEARPLIIGACVCNAVNVLAALAHTVVASTYRGTQAIGIEGVSALAGIGAVILFLLFLKKVCDFVGDTSSAVNAHSLMVFYIVAGSLLFFFVLSIPIVTPFLDGMLKPIYVIIGGLTLLIVLIIWLFHFLQFIKDLNIKPRTRRR